MNPSTQTLLAEAAKRADQAAQEWLKSTLPNVDATVRNMLDSRLESVVFKLLGFAPADDGWQIDHCNGRSGESAAGTWLRGQARESAKQWLSEQADKLPRLSQSTIAEIRNEYRVAFDEEVRRLCHARALEDARAEVARMFAKTLAPATPAAITTPMGQ